MSFSLLIADAVSLGTLTDELGRLYRDPELSLPPTILSFRDYVLAIEGLQESELRRRAESYWRERLVTLPPAVELPVVRDPATLESHHLKRRSGRLEASAWDRFQKRATELDLTPTASLTALYAEVLAAWSHNSVAHRFSLNILYFNRLPLHAEVDALVGNLSATLLLEVEVAPHHSFARRARNLQEQLWRDLEHGIYSGVEVVRDLNRLRGGAPRAAMPVVMSSALNLRRRNRSLLGLGERLGFTSVQTPQVWLDHQVEETPEGELAFNFDTVEELFPPGMIDEMFAAYGRLLHQLATEPESWQVGTFDLLPPASRARWAAVNRTGAPVPESLLSTPFVARARLNPDRPAVITSERVLSYGELAARAAAIGHRLRHLGARPGQLVAVAMSKGWEQAVAVLAILHAGAAYLPLDPSQPRERLHRLLRRGAVRIALTQPQWREHLSGSPVQEIVEIVPDPIPGPAVADASWDTPLQRSDDLAYVIFTSGSTGEPKGVMIEHRGAVNTIHDINQRLDLGPGDRVLALSELSFDLSVWDFFGLWAAGGATVLPEPGALREPESWTAGVAEHGVTVWSSVPALMAMWVDHLEGRGEDAPPSLRQVMLSGDWIPVTLPDRLQTRRQPVSIWSLGGATEASIWSIAHLIEEVDPAWPSIPYGKPMTNQSFHVLDDALHPRPAWVPGELYIGGIGLARGYWRDPQRTAESFRPLPETGERVYRTGDLGRYHPDGTIEFLGRVDFQVKVQGYRIELGEIEATLAQHAGVRSAVVVASGDPKGDKRLVAYTVGSASEDELRSFLAEKLPDYMVPRTFISLPALPLSANGKVDRKALPAPETASRRQSSAAPRTEMERRLAEIWEELLDTGPIGAHDDFFESGGHSLLAVQLMVRIRRELGTDLPLASLFEEPTVEHLAALLTQQRGAVAGSLRVPLTARLKPPRSERPAFYCVHPVGGSCLCYLELGRRLGWPTFGLQNLDQPATEMTLESLAQRYLEDVDGPPPYLLGGWSMGGVVAFEMARQLAKRGAAVGLVALIDPPPATPKDSLDEAALAAWFASDLTKLWGRPRHFPAAEWRDLRPGQLLERLGEELSAAEVLTGVGPAELQRLFARFRINARALQDYRPRPYPGPLEIYQAAESESAEGWRNYADEVTVHVLPGDHYTLLREPRVTELATRLATDLAAAYGDSGPREPVTVRSPGSPAPGSARRSGPPERKR